MRPNESAEESDNQQTSTRSPDDLFLSSSENRTTSTPQTANDENPERRIVPYEGQKQQLIFSNSFPTYTRLSLVFEWCRSLPPRLDVYSTSPPTVTTTHPQMSEQMPTTEAAIPIKPTVSSITAQLESVILEKPPVDEVSDKLVQPLANDSQMNIVESNSQPPIDDGYSMYLKDPMTDSELQVIDQASQQDRARNNEEMLTEDPPLRPVPQAQTKYTFLTIKELLPELKGRGKIMIQGTVTLTKYSEKTKRHTIYIDDPTGRIKLFYPEPPDIIALKKIVNELETKWLELHLSSEALNKEQDELESLIRSIKELIKSRSSFKFPQKILAVGQYFEKYFYAWDVQHCTTEEEIRFKKRILSRF